MKNKRISWDKYFIGWLDRVAGRATCDRGRNAAIITIDNEIVTTGYVGSPSGLPHCDDVGHLMHKTVDENGDISQHCIRTLHAEQNAILQATKKGKIVKGGTLYCRMTPCYTCAKMIVQVGIKRIVAEKKYHADKLSRELFKDAKIKLEILDDKLVKYKNQ